MFHVKQLEKEMVIKWEVRDMMAELVGNLSNHPTCVFGGQRFHNSLLYKGLRSFLGFSEVGFELDLLPLRG